MAPLQNKVTHVVTAFVEGELRGSPPGRERFGKAAVSSKGNFGGVFESRIKLTEWPSTFSGELNFVLETLRGE